MRSHALVALALIVVAGCSAPPPKFVDEAQELRYLSALSNPTPEQFLRKEALEQKVRDDARHRMAQEGLRRLDEADEEYKSEKAAGR